MRKNIHQISSTTPTVQIAQIRGVSSLYTPGREVRLLAKIIALSKAINGSKILKGKKAPFEKIYNPQQPNIYFRLKRSGNRNVFVVRSSAVGHELFKLLNQDIESIKVHFPEHIFSPYFEAFLEARTELKNRAESAKNFRAFPKNLLSSMSLESAKLAIRLGYLFVRLIQEKGLGRIENSYDEPVRKNILSLKRYLTSLTDEHQGPPLVQALTLTLLTEPSEPLQTILGYSKREEESLDIVKPFPPPPLEELTPRAELYKALKRAREEYLKALKKEELVRRYLCGYIWKLAYNTHISWSYKLLLFYDSSVLREHSRTFQAAESLWASMIKPLEAMKISDFALSLLHSHTQQTLENAWLRNSKAEFIEQVVSQIISPDYLVRVQAPTKDKTFGKGNYRI